jgi:hypothetical protein
MSKKLIAALMAVAALAAFAVAATSASATTLTQPTGTAVATGTKVKATNTSIAIFNASGLKVECSNDVLTGTITKNTTEVEGTIETASFKGTEAEEKCVGSLGATRVTTTGAGFNGTPWCVTAGAEDVLTIRGNGCASAARSLTFALDVPGAECKYERTTLTGPVKGTYTTDVSGSDAIGTIAAGANSEFKGESTNSFICPGTGTLQMTFTLETDPTSGASSPMYLS